MLEITAYDFPDHYILCPPVLELEEDQKHAQKPSETRKMALIPKKFGKMG
jgi:hypothetical protein